MNPIGLAIEGKECFGHTVKGRSVYESGDRKVPTCSENTKESISQYS